MYSWGKGQYQTLGWNKDERYEIANPFG